MFFAVGISRNQYDCGWRVPWRIDLQILKICININVLSIVMAEAQAAPTLSKSGVICHKSLYKHSLYLTPMSLPVVISLFQCIIFWRVG